MLKERSAPQTHINRPPRQNNENPQRCDNNNIVTSGLNQPKSTGSNMNKVQLMPQRHEMSSGHFNADQIEILKNSICKDATNDEFAVFLMACQKTQLDPFMRQIYAVKRYDSRLKRETMTIQTGIDGYRLIAERTGRYAPGPKTTFEYDKEGKILSATAYVKKLTQDGTWHIVEAEAFFDEYCQTYTDKSTGQKKKTGMWVNMERNQLGKCAESLALRKAFPAELSGVYTKDEMKQSDNIISQVQADELLYILNECEPEYKESVLKTLRDKHNAPTIFETPVEIFERVRSAALRKMGILKSQPIQEVVDVVTETKKELIQDEPIEITGREPTSDDVYPKRNSAFRGD
jgi:phage recombination protein Bet